MNNPFLIFRLSNAGCSEARFILHLKSEVSCTGIKRGWFIKGLSFNVVCFRVGGGSWALIWQNLLGGRIYRPKPPVRPWTKEHEVPIDTPNPWFWGYGHPGGRTMECNQRFFPPIGQGLPAYRISIVNRYFEVGTINRINRLKPVNCSTKFTAVLNLLQY